MRDGRSRPFIMGRNVFETFISDDEFKDDEAMTVEEFFEDIVGKKEKPFESPEWVWVATMRSVEDPTYSRFYRASPNFFELLEVFYHRYTYEDKKMEFFMATLGVSDISVENRGELDNKITAVYFEVEDRNHEECLLVIEAFRAGRLPEMR